AAVARVPDEPVVAGAEEGGVVAAVAVDRVVAVPTEEKLRAGSPGERVVPVASCDHRSDAGSDGTVAVVDADGVVASAGIDEDRLDLVATEAEVAGAVVSFVDLEHVGLPGLEPQRDLVGRVAADDEQCPVLNSR